MMFFPRKKQGEAPVLSSLQKKGANDLELALLPPNLKHLQRKIFRLRTLNEKDTQLNGVVPDNPQAEASATLTATTNSTSSSGLQQTHSAADGNNKRSKLEESLPRFGPCYGSDIPFMSDTKDKAWEHVLKKTSDDMSEAKEIFFSAVRRVEAKAREIYGDAIDFSPLEFRLMMLKDGCFFLQLALLILGDNVQFLGYPSNHVFGKKPNTMESRRWMESMFFVGNQIPLVILRELMAQKFFQDVIAKGKWDPRISSSLCRKVLYQLLVSPARKDALPSDLLHGLYDMVIGPGSPEEKEKKKKMKKKSGIYEVKDDFDLEANQEDIFGDGGRKNRLSVANDTRKMFPSATDLDLSGIYIAKLTTGGVRGISFKSYYFWATLSLPAFPIDDGTEIVFRNLKTYENSQQLEKHQQEVCSFLRLMSDVVQTSKDVKLLKRKGVIEGNPGDGDELPEMLKSLSSDFETLSHDFRVLRRKLYEYSGPPWARIKSILNVVALLTFIQTFFTVFAYFRPPKQN